MENLWKKIQKEKEMDCTEIECKREGEREKEIERKRDTNRERETVRS